MKKLVFENKCSHEVMILVNDKYKLNVLAYKSASIYVDECEALEIRVRQDKSSFLKKMYRFTIETKYVLSNKDNEMSFDIMREIIRASSDSYYEKIILNTHFCVITNEENYIYDLERIKRKYKKRNILYSLLVSPFEHMPGLCIASFILNLILIYKFGWKSAVLFFVLAYLFICILNYLVGKFSDFVFKKAKFFVDDKLEFDIITDNKYVNDFFNNPYRKAYMNDRNIEGI